MAQLLHRLGLGAARRPLLAILAWALALALAIGGFLAFSGTLSTTITIPGTPTSQLTEKLQDEFPEAAHGSGEVVFTTTDGSAFTPQQRREIADVLEDVTAMESVHDTRDPFALEQQRADGEEELTTGRAELKKNKEKISSGEKELETAKEELETSRTELEEAQRTLDAAKEEALEQGAAAGLTQADVDAQFETQQDQLDAGFDELEKGEKEIEKNEKELAEGRKKIKDGEADLETGERTLELTDGYRSVSEDESTAVGAVVFTDPLIDVEADQMKAVSEALEQADVDGVQIHPSQAINATVPSIVGPAEIIGLAVAAVVLIIMLGSFVAAGLPLLNALVGVGVGVSGALAFSSLVQMNSVTPVLGVMLGLAVGIDYALFIINRHRQQLKAGLGVRESIALADGTAGNAVVFAGLTVVIALAALNVTGIPFLGLMGTVGAVCVAVAVLVAVTLTPALLSLIGERALSKKERAALAAGEVHDLHASVSRRPDGSVKTLSTPRAVLTALLATAALVVIALPSGSMRLGLPDGGSQPIGSDSQRAYELMDERFGPGYNGPLVVTADLPAGLDENAATSRQLDIAESIARMPHVEAAVPAAVNEDRSIAMVQVIPETGPNAIETEQLVHELRTTPGPDGEHLDVAGMTSGFIDVSEKLSDALPLYLGLVVGLSLLIMVVVFRSLLVPLIATGGFMLSVFAAMGAVVAVYQWGWLAQVFGVHAPGPVLSFLPTIMIGILFGLAMDYQLFIASGMREAYAHGAPARAAVRMGLRTGRSVVIAAAIIMVSVFGGFIFSHDTMIRPIGFGLTLGILFDAFVVRLLLMPALMHLLGASAWWLPSWLDRILPDVDVEGSQLEREHPTSGSGASAVESDPAGGHRPRRPTPIPARGPADISYLRH